MLDEGAKHEHLRFRVFSKITHQEFQPLLIQVWSLLTRSNEELHC